ncbi:YgjV family protein [Halieaceae bacterium IMCC14734]|uniref:YgjV family protein n=1 Tax=Candidatus Litorirhabdus singularis TaxID=2518993 RepID=A0ABT3TJW6_9GAMM|nr:YgjV family protein [Candidatus Litorirhabdus singularis]MCX2982085.1 YgjV family protein [Candidatus Litorirhabdus singularis]
MSDFVLSQILVGITFFFSTVSFQFRDQRAVKLCLVIGCVFLAAHFYLLEAYTAAVTTTIAAVRFTVSMYWRDDRLFYLFFAMVLVNAVLTYSGLLTVLATIATGLSTWAAFRHSDKQFRMFMMAASSVMMIHNILVGTPIAVLMEVFFIGSNLIAYRRLYRRRGLSE